MVILVASRRTLTFSYAGKAVLRWFDKYGGVFQISIQASLSPPPTANESSTHERGEPSPMGKAGLPPLEGETSSIPPPPYGDEGIISMGLGDEVGGKQTGE